MFNAVENNGTDFAPKQSLYQKVAVGLENPKIKSPFRCKIRTGCYGPANNPASCTVYRTENENLGNSKLSKTMVPPLHQSNLYIKRYLWLRRTQKCNHLFCVINALGVRTGQITQFYATCRGQRMEIWECSAPSKTTVPPLHQSNVYIKGSCGYGESTNEIAFSVQ